MGNFDLLVTGAVVMLASLYLASGAHLPTFAVVTLQHETSHFLCGHHFVAFLLTVMLKDPYITSRNCVLTL